MSENQNMEMDWNDSIESDGGNYEPLGEGDFNFVVTKFERGRFPGSAKLTACNKATITVEAMDTANDRSVPVTFDLLLHRQLEWKLSAFFRAIGQKKHGEKLAMDWNKVVGAMGRAHFKPRKWTNKNGEERFSDDLEKFYDYDEKAMNQNSEEVPF